MILSKRFAPLVVLLPAAALLATACSGSGTSSSASGGTSSTSATASGGSGNTSASGASGVAYAQAQVAKLRAVPKFTPPGPAFDVSKVRGKSMFVIPAASNDYDNTIETEMKQIAAKYGVKYTQYTNQGKPTEWVTGLNEALSQHPDIIVLNTALDPRQVMPELQRAQSEHIPVLATHFFDQDYAKSLGTKCGGTATLCSAGLTATVNAPFNAATRAEADWIIADSGGKAHVLVISANDAAPSQGMVSAANDELHKQCPGCSVNVQNIAVGDWATKIQPLVQTALTRDPQLHYVMPLFDFGASFAASGVNAAGKAATTKIVSYNGTQNVLAMLEKHNVVAMDVGEPLNWLGYAFMDQTFRVLAGQPTVEENTPIRVFDAKNIADTGTPPTVTGGYGSAYVSGYTSLWTTP